MLLLPVLCHQNYFYFFRLFSSLLFLFFQLRSMAGRFECDDKIGTKTPSLKCVCVHCTVSGHPSGSHLGSQHAGQVIFVYAERSRFSGSSFQSLFACSPGHIRVMVRLFAATGSPPLTGASLSLFLVDKECLFFSYVHQIN